jgi:hypothetical protein
MKKIVYSILITLPFILISCGNGEEKNSLTDKEIIPVKVIPAEKIDVQRTISASGQFTTDDETYL